MPILILPFAGIEVGADVVNKKKILCQVTMAFVRIVIRMKEIPKRKSMIPTNIPMYKSMIDKLDQIAFQNNCGRSKVVRHLLSKAIPEYLEES